MAGTYQFAPRIRYHFSDETLEVWEYRDRLMLSLLLGQIKSTFSHLVSPVCCHLQGPNGVKTAITGIQNALANREFQYVIRADIRSYYASIDRKILLRQIQESFDDPRVFNYLNAIITAPIDDGGRLLTPDQGIPRRSSVSPFFGAIYLSPLDQAFEHQPGVFYLRYMDDIILLAQTKRQFVHARKKLYAVLRKLKLKLSPSKTKMGKIHSGFHFLGVQFAASRNPQTQSQEMTATIHSRSCSRALEKVRVKKTDAVHPAKIQRYLLQWASWWGRTVSPLTALDLIRSWVAYTQSLEPDCVWLGKGWLLR